MGYTVDGPLSTIFSPDCRLFYLKSFSFLWRLKRMEFALSSLWRDQLLLARLPHGLSEDLTPILHVVQLLGAEFRHFVLQLQYYVNFEVCPSPLQSCTFDYISFRKREGLVREEKTDNGCLTLHFNI